MKMTPMKTVNIHEAKNSALETHRRGVKGWVVRHCQGWQAIGKSHCPPRSNRCSSATTRYHGGADFWAGRLWPNGQRGGRANVRRWCIKLLLDTLLLLWAAAEPRRLSRQARTQIDNPDKINPGHAVELFSATGRGCGGTFSAQTHAIRAFPGSGEGTHLSYVQLRSPLCEFVW